RQLAAVLQGDALALARSGADVGAQLHRRQQRVVESPTSPQRHTSPQQRPLDALTPARWRGKGALQYGAADALGLRYLEHAQGGLQPLAQLFMTRVLGAPGLERLMVRLAGTSRAQQH